MLYIFDIDGTVVPFNSEELLPGVAEWFENNKDSVAFISNQGGVSLYNFLKSQERDTEQYPCEEAVRGRLNRIIAGLPKGPYPLRICFAYQARSTGNWLSFPDDRTKYHPEWSKHNRKPAPGMVYETMLSMGVTDKSEVMVVGDAIEDQEAAFYAGVRFMWADEFFGRETE